MKKLLLLSVLLFSACAELTPTQQLLLTGASGLAQQGVKAVATYYGGEAAGQLASAGYSAAAAVLQGYVGHQAPPAVVSAAPGVNRLATILLSNMNTGATVKQSDVNTLHKAAALAAVE